jgi:hypothetical protein
MSTPVTQDILEPGYTVTGIRQDVGEGGPVVITGTYMSIDKPQPLLYRGPLVPTDPAGYCYLSPHFRDQPAVNSSVFYGPNTPLYDPALGVGNVRAVGSCKFVDGGGRDHGMMYEGDYDGRGSYTLIDVPEDVAGGEVGNTLAHSTMGDLVVGNYDLLGKAGSGNGFIYSIGKRSFTVLNISKYATIYGVWQNGDNSDAYTLAGGYDGEKGINQGFLLDYDAATGQFGRLASYSYNNAPGIITHFEGIAGLSDGGYTLAAQWKQKPDDSGGAAFAQVARDADGHFPPKASWVDIVAAGPCTANSVLGYDVIGIYTTGAGAQSYVASALRPEAAAQRISRMVPRDAGRRTG